MRENFSATEFLLTCWLIQLYVLKRWVYDRCSLKKLVWKLPSSVTDVYLWNFQILQGTCSNDCGNNCFLYCPFIVCFYYCVLKCQCLLTDLYQICTLPTQVLISRSRELRFWVWANLVRTLKSLSRNCPGNIYLFKVENRNTRKRCEICSKLIKTPERRQWRCSSIFIVKFEQISHPF